MSEPSAAVSPSTPPEWHLLAGTEALRALESTERGLSTEEARRRLAIHGLNQIEEGEREPAWKLLLGQFTNYLVVILIVAAVLSFVLGQHVEGTAILVIVVLAAVMGFVQEYKAERAMEELRELASPVTKAFRDGQIVDLKSHDLVPGDVIPISAGDVVPADARLLDAKDLRVVEAILTGESMPADKSTAALVGPAIPVADRKNLVHSGTAVVYGRGKGIVVATGMATEFGKIAKLLQQQKADRTPLQKALDRLGTSLGTGSLVLAALVALLGIVRGHALLDMFLWGVSLAVAVIPEALPAVVTVSLALAVKRLVKRRSLIRRLPAVETLGSTTVIASDKTGTMTTGEMTVRRVWLPAMSLEVTGAGYRFEGDFLEGGQKIDPRIPPEIDRLVEAAVLCNDAELVREGDRLELHGDPTEGALLALAGKTGASIDGIRKAYPRVDEIAFSSERMRMTTVHEKEAGRVAYSKGAPEVLLECCTHVLAGDRREPISPEEKRRILEQSYALASQALRSLALAFREVGPGDAPIEQCERGMTYIGTVSLMDPPRPEVRDAVTRCREAGIRVLMVTGDHMVTARAVAAELGILSEGGITIAGPEFDRMPDEELDRSIDRIQVFARVTPAHKLRIVEAFKRKGQIVAMTGDGVNDAPALKRADIGVAMGVSGTGVSREAAAMILTDDNFASIASAVEEGRRTFDNIRKYLVFLLSGNMGAIFAMVFALLFLSDLPLPLTAVQVLFINMILDGLPAIALSVERAERGLMRRPPRDPKRPMLDREAIFLILGIGLVVAALTTWIFVATFRSHGGDEAAGQRAVTLFFVTLILARLVNAYNFRSFRESVFSTGFFSNTWLVAGIGIALGLTALVVQVPAMGNVFRVVPLSSLEWGVAFALALVTLVVQEAAKLVRRLWRQRA
ncbi:MAG: cation-translocating P-type ATPase [Planctomycetes bacterium]|nr:cation-translocating P-type ATPase [Planctomycetota bacterium]